MDLSAHLNASDGYRQLVQQISDAYQLYQPDREALRRELEETLREAGQ